MSEPAGASAAPGVPGGGAQDEVRRWQAPEMGAPQRVPAGGGGVLTAERVAEIEAQARLLGYERGLEEGRAAGAAELGRERDRLGRLVESISPQAGLLDEDLMEQIAALVLAVARQFIRRELAQEPGEIVRVVREALQVLPVSTTAVRISVHPEDAPRVRELLVPERLDRPVTVLEDALLTRGGARLETDVSLVDATVESRLNAIAARLLGNARATDQDRVTDADA